MYLAMAKRYASDAEKEYLLAGASDRRDALFHLRQVDLSTLHPTPDLSTLHPSPDLSTLHLQLVSQPYTLH